MSKKRVLAEYEFDKKRKVGFRMYFQWKDVYSTKITEIDKQHKRLFEIGGKISDLVLARGKHDRYDEIMSILRELMDYTNYHFKFEEKLMNEHNFQEMEMHKVEHEFFIRKIQRMQDKDIDANQKEAIVELISFISDWISGHILKSDMRYKNYFIEKGVN